jgi:EAL domain-containing protein (putative c-di-GMP-specific phosphodiesterase class I)
VKWLERVIAHRIAARGPAAAWEISAAAIVAPYLAFFAAGQPAAASAVMAGSLAFSLVLLAGLRGALLFGESPSLAQLPDEPRDVGATLTGLSLSSAARSPTTGLPLRDALRGAVEDHDPAAGPALFAIIRFSNHAAMLAYDVSAARNVMLEFGRRFEAAAGRRPMAQTSEDSFAIFFAGPAARDSAEAELKSIAYVVGQEIIDTHIAVAPDIHVGAAWLRSPLDTFTSLVAAAEASLVPLKRFGYAKAHLGKSSAENLADRFAIEQALRRAVLENQLFLCYQPLIDTYSGRVAGAEALLRWRHPAFGDVSPARFVPILEETGLIHEIGLWTLNSGCRQLREWRSAGHDLRLAINLSAIQLQDRSLSSLIERTVASHGLAPADIELELTETAAMEDQARTIGLFEELRGKGFGIAIDDFGSGHSNLSYLKNLPFTKLKIDREFVSHSDTRSGSQAICKALVELGVGLGISVLAEGVERYEEVAVLRRLGCRLFQGFYFAQPLAAEILSSKLVDPSWLSLLGSEVHRSHAELQKRIIQ